MRPLPTVNDAIDLILQGTASGGLEQLLQAIPSGELQQLVGPPGQYSGALGESPFRSGGFVNQSGSLGMGKLESMELPDATAAVAMLHDMPPEVSICRPQVEPRPLSLPAPPPSKCPAGREQP